MARTVTKGRALPRPLGTIERRVPATRTGEEKPMARNRDMTMVVCVKNEAEVKAAALREAADDLYTDAGPQNPLSVATWLRARADALDAE